MIFTWEFINLVKEKTTWRVFFLYHAHDELLLNFWNFKSVRLAGVPVELIPNFRQLNRMFWQEKHCNSIPHSPPCSSTMNISHES